MPRITLIKERKNKKEFWPELFDSSKEVTTGYTKTDYAGDRSLAALSIGSVEPEVIETAYGHCRRVIKKGSKGFYFSTIFLPPPKRRAMWAVYNFCRLTDDLVDQSQSRDTAELLEKLEDWEKELLRSYEGKVKVHLPYMLAWHHTATTYNIPQEPPLELIEGVRMDIAKFRYANFEELKLYCYRVASTVGLMASEVIGYSEPCALEYAVQLGIALQLTNILRDIGEDAQIGRIYLPQDEMAYYGYTEENLLNGVINQNFIRLMQFQIERARQLYKKAMPGIELLHRDSRLAITVAAEQYSRILDAIERNGYNVFQKRAFVPMSEKLGCLAKVWLRRRFRPVPLPLISSERVIRENSSPTLFVSHGEEADA